MPAIALTDHGALYGAIDFYVAANQAGIKPILGVETYIARTNRFERDPRLDGHGNPFHLVLLAKGFTGYRKPRRVVTTGTWTATTTARHGQGGLRSTRGLIALSACLQGGRRARSRTSHRRRVQGRAGASGIFAQANYDLE